MKNIASHCLLSLWSVVLLASCSVDKNTETGAEAEGAAAGAPTNVDVALNGDSSDAGNEINPVDGEAEPEPSTGGDSTVVGDGGSEPAVASGGASGGEGGRDTAVGVGGSEPAAASGGASGGEGGGGMDVTTEIETAGGAASETEPDSHGEAGAAGGAQDAPECPSDDPECSVEVTHVAVGDEFQCASFSNNVVKCWGNNETPAPVEGLVIEEGVEIAALSAGWYHTCALLTDNTVQCWGSNHSGQLGRPGTGQMGPAPVEGLVVNPGATAVAVHAQFFRTCLLFSDSTIQCWGESNSCHLGPGLRPAEEHVPALVEALSLTDGVTVSASSLNDGYTCALLSDSTVQCWGSDLVVLDRETSAPDDTCIAAPVEGLAVPDGATVTAVFAGEFHACVSLSDNTVQCWGTDIGGTLGRADVSRAPAPVEGLPVNDGIDITGVIAAPFASCSLRSDSSVLCWGGGVGGGAPVDGGEHVRQVQDLPPGDDISVVELAAGEFRASVLLSNNTVHFWDYDTMRLEPAADLF